MGGPCRIRIQFRWTGGGSQTNGQGTRDRRRSRGAVAVPAMMIWLKILDGDMAVILLGGLPYLAADVGSSQAWTLHEEDLMDPILSICCFAKKEIQ
ncbi:hypothetical protein SAY86_024306 [Trapa natans]|uniref:Uncharacterized protein n=1 Tax=Trapa natans TaxID=22666 RepID=A0AAN7M4M5_TRANT|nr:hypothetical protein SAY86_024306 [Trapa natans]